MSCNQLQAAIIRSFKRSDPSCIARCSDEETVDIRRWGLWVAPEGERDEDHDWRILENSWREKAHRIMDSLSSSFDGYTFNFETSEKDYIIVTASKKITEGIYKSDLMDLIDPVISIDEYQSKILDDDDSIVVTFRVQNRDAAFDLSSFIERGPFPVLDTEVSDRLDSDGYYPVFIEMNRSKKFIRELLMMISKINVISKRKFKDWTFKSYKMAGTRHLTKEELKNNVRLQTESQLPVIPDDIDDPLNEAYKFIMRQTNY
jgi:hypothetical protein